MRGGWRLLALQFPAVLRVRLPGALPRVSGRANAGAGGGAEGGGVVSAADTSDDGAGQRQPSHAAEEGRRVQRRRAGGLRPLRRGRTSS